MAKKTKGAKGAHSIVTGAVVTKGAPKAKMANYGAQKPTMNKAKMTGGLKGGRI